jgi:hypothetical protein
MFHSLLQNDKVKVKLPLCLLNKAPHHEEISGSGGIAPPFLTSALGVSEWSGSHPNRFTPGKGAPGTRWIGGWVAARAGLDAVESPF